MTDELDQIITLDELLGWMHVSRKTIVNRLRERRDLPPHFRCGRKILFRRSVVQAWIEAQEAAAKATAAVAGREPGGGA
jgi:predicted DNA-binding transcriptional regulator AlpA